MHLARERARNLGHYYFPPRTQMFNLSLETLVLITIELNRIYSSYRVLPLLEYYYYGHC